MLDTIESYIKSYKEKENLYVKKKVSIIGSPLAAGQPLGGVQLACDDLRKLGLHNVIDMLGWKYEDIGNIDNGDNEMKQEKKTNNYINNNDNNNDNNNVYNNDNNNVYNNDNNNVYNNDNNNNNNNCYIPNGVIKEKKHDLSNNKMNGYVNHNFYGNYEENNVISTNDKYKSNCYYDNIRNIKEIGIFSKNLFDTMSNELRKKNFVLNIGGDHGVAFSSILSSLQMYQNLRVIWIDAHGDINIPETSPSGNYHGMTLAHTLGLFKKKVPYFEWSEKLTYLKPENTAIIGIRDIDTYEKIILKKCNINYYTIFDIEKNGIYNTICTALEKIDPDSNCPIHISLDIDSVDNVFAPGTGTVAKGGLNYREINLLMKILAETKRVVSMDLVEYNPSLDEVDQKVHGDSLPILDNATKTGKLCLELIARVLGYDIV
ncbi:arginase, putative [Plasmodium reichenowi]|uniref:Arginase, putative n=1 Tax=Plasmodium reichenowi TaxID=5854 RepID=A0A151LHE0_PLARE|nr:arginase, putative [Plasmodium reichenowi]KYN98352.1 arginase, putative [Plasmodium reichenowi]